MIDPLIINARPLRQATKEHRERDTRERLALVREKDSILSACYRRPSALGEVRTVLFQIIMQFSESLPGHRHLLPAIPLTMHVQQAEYRVNITQPQTYQLFTTKACVNRNTDNGPIARGQG